MAAPKIGPHPIFKIFGLTYIDDGAVLVLVDVAARAVWQQFQLVFDCLVHRSIVPYLTWKKGSGKELDKLKKSSSTSL